jgi:Rrf2 family transcriptional regulator, iron-sulfur cluster assembly transcription factor
MTVIFSKKCEYGLQATLFLATLGKNEKSPSEEISKKLKIPKEFVSKILQSLTASKIIKSKKGNSGGFLLGKPASEIRLIDIVEAIDGLTMFKSCVIGFPGCSPEHPCPVHHKWGKLRTQAYDMLSAETIESFNAKTLKKIHFMNKTEYSHAKQ